MTTPPHLRLARPVADPDRSGALYCRGLGWVVLGAFVDHAGFDGVMVGAPGAAYHVEFTRCRHHPVAPTPTREDLLVLYLPDPDAWSVACARMTDAGFHSVASLNPYWDQRGRTFEDDDGYRVVLQRSDWPSA